MKERSKLTTRTMAFLLIILILSFIVNSLELAHSPSPAPMGEELIMAKELNLYRGRARKAMRGSFPARCHSKCNKCRPCMPVQVSIRAMELKEKEYYYPQVWKCICGDGIFSP
ncbi:hypothetical protein JCGZ_16323 [Jatropha curcas]|uniref:Epidermal patterning factor-like protein n=1 Tax=Jatropha curcas TaxID=180498 RepID=A0A067LIN3_JATCU|nr:EPIDERMAL PATTERNING FACTOR-like protein 4 [Jatropha curcas]KDP44490.1 hypothetical protein JCGZ_16323 [Jatropha curcas]